MMDSFQGGWAEIVKGVVLNWRQALVTVVLSPLALTLLFPLTVWLPVAAVLLLGGWRLRTLGRRRLRSWRFYLPAYTVIPLGLIVGAIGPVVGTSSAPRYIAFKELSLSNLACSSLVAGDVGSELCVFSDPLRSKLPKGLWSRLAAHVHVLPIDSSSGETIVRFPWIGHVEAAARSSVDLAVRSSSQTLTMPGMQFEYQRESTPVGAQSFSVGPAIVPVSIKYVWIQSALPWNAVVAHRSDENLLRYAALLDMALQSALMFRVEPAFDQLEAALALAPTDVERVRTLTVLMLFARGRAIGSLGAQQALPILNSAYQLITKTAPGSFALNAGLLLWSMKEVRSAYESYGNLYGTRIINLNSSIDRLSNSVAAGFLEERGRSEKSGSGQGRSLKRQRFDGDFAEAARKLKEFFQKQSLKNGDSDLFQYAFPWDMERIETGGIEDVNAEVSKMRSQEPYVRLAFVDALIGMAANRCIFGAGSSPSFCSELTGVLRGPLAEGLPGEIQRTCLKKINLAVVIFAFSNLFKLSSESDAEKFLVEAIGQVFDGFESIGQAMPGIKLVMEEMFKAAGKKPEMDRDLSLAYAFMESTLSRAEALTDASSGLRWWHARSLDRESLFLFRAAVRAGEWKLKGYKTVPAEVGAKLISDGQRRRGSARDLFLPTELFVVMISENKDNSGLKRVRARAESQFESTIEEVVTKWVP